MSETISEDRVAALRLKVERAATTPSALTTGQLYRREWCVSLFCSSLVEGGSSFQTWYGKSLAQALDRAEQDINRWCDNAMGERGGGDEC